ncbi:MAG TPA: 16S rRNA (guanine(527)-N(7))-methyltransferase RsmG [Chloroflexota bacterium]|nr:16S rRNA (guanine(527)-N(7))-methyltransferase RsmG [Chloroflexota bacterium]
MPGEPHGTATAAASGAPSPLQSAAEAVGVTLSSPQLALFKRFRDVLLEWNARVNLTAIRDPAEMEVKHFADCLACLKADLPEQARLLDVGSGAGLPGIALAIARPDLHVTLLEATAKKAAFLRHAGTTLGLSLSVAAQRAEEHGEREAYGVVVARAVAALPALLELTLPFCATGGRVLAMKKGAGVATEIAQSRVALRLLGGQLEPPLSYELAGEPRQILVIRKVRSTPAEYPRRPGLPAKRPLGS